MSADPRNDPRADDLLSADPGVVSTLASTFRTVAMQAQGAADGLRGAQGDATWTGPAATAFRQGVGKLPGDLGKATSSYQEAGDALTVYEGELSSLQPAFRSVVSQLGSADAQLAGAQSNLSFAQSALGAAQAKLTQSAINHPLSPLQSVPANSPLVSAVGTANAAVSNAQGNIDGLSARGFHILDEFDTARNAAKGKVDSASQVPPQPGFWDSLFHDVGNFLGGAVHFVEGIGAGIWNSVTGTVSAFENFVNHPSLATFGQLASDVTVDAGIVLLAATAPEALGLVGGAEVLAEGAAEVVVDGGTAALADDGAGVLAHAEADPLGALGSAAETHPAELQAAMDQIDEAGGEFVFRDGNMGYSPGSAGQAGRLIFDPEGSYGALLHEMTHFADDAAAGFPGFGAWISDPAAMAGSEANAYGAEIAYANSLGESDIAAQLEQLRDARIAQLLPPAEPLP